MTEQQVPIGQLKARLSQYLTRARAGESIVVTDRGTPVARLAPLDGAVGQVGRASELIRAGLARQPARPLPTEFFDAIRPSDPGGRSLDTVLEERAEGW